MARKDRADLKNKGITSLKVKRDTTTAHRREIKMTLQDNLNTMVEFLQKMLNKRVGVSGVVRAFSYLSSDTATLNKVAKSFKDNI